MPTSTLFRWSKVKPSGGNEKLRKTLVKLAKGGIVGFSIPAFKSSTGFVTCPRAGICAGVCYARQGRYVMASVASVREHNLAKALGYDGNAYALGEALVRDLSTMRASVVRVHDSGDFFAPWYFEAWCYAASQFEGTKRFYAYTKSIPVDWRKVPPNFSIVQSLGGTRDSEADPSRPIARIFPTMEDKAKALDSGVWVDGDASDIPAIVGEPRIAFCYHGTRNITLAQIKAFQGKG